MSTTLNVVSFHGPTDTACWTKRENSFCRTATSFGQIETYICPVYWGYLSQADTPVYLFACSACGCCFLFLKSGHLPMEGIFTPPMLTKFLEIIRENKKLYLSVPFHLVLIITNLKNFVKYISESDGVRRVN